LIERRRPPGLGRSARFLPRIVIERQRLVLEVVLVREGQVATGSGVAAAAHGAQDLALFALYLGGVGTAPALQIEVLTDRVVQQTHSP
jgi:hypothetical protein